MVCVGKWTWESGEKKSVLDHMLFGKGLDVIKIIVEDSGNLNIGSNDDLIWGEMVWGRTEVEVRREWYKCKVNGRIRLGALSGSSRGRVHRVGEGESD